MFKDFTTARDLQALATQLTEEECTTFLARLEADWKLAEQTGNLRAMVITGAKVTIFKKAYRFEVVSEELLAMAESGEINA